MNRHLPIVLGAVLAAGLAGCESQPPQSPSAGLTQPFNPPRPADLGNAPGTVEVEDLGPYNMYVTDSVRLICSGPDPFFAFDSAKPKLDDQPTMKNLVDCMLHGALLGKSIKLVGHTDPRGTAGYNERLGLDRAAKVKSFLVANGVDPARIQTMSAGSDDAAKAPQQWARDRRVQVDLAP
jgi:peptidoglycan-associated lipoprotein